MGRPLDEDMVINIIKNGDYYMTWVDRAMLIEEIKDLPSAQVEKAYKLGRESVQPEQIWIPCSERLPEVPCLVSDANNNFPYVPAGIITLEDKEHGKWAIDGKWFERMMLDGKEADMLIYSNRIIAWMPLPKPYKEGDTK